MLQWKIARLVWIAFYKNEKNDKCFIDKLPKDILTNYILKFLGRDYRTVTIKKNKVAFGRVALG